MRLVPPSTVLAALAACVPSAGPIAGTPSDATATDARDATAPADDAAPGADAAVDGGPDVEADAAPDTCPADCPAPADACHRRRCPGGACILVTADEAPCDDGDPCTVFDFCTAALGTCIGQPVSCDDDDPCTTDRCVDGACVSEAAATCVDPATDPAHCGDAAAECLGGTCADGHCTRCERAFDAGSAFTAWRGLDCPEMPVGARVAAHLEGALAVPDGVTVVTLWADAEGDPMASCASEGCLADGPCGFPAGCAVRFTGPGSFPVDLHYELFAPYPGATIEAKFMAWRPEAASGGATVLSFDRETHLGIAVVGE